jgi:hypothetical protein
MKYDAFTTAYIEAMDFTDCHCDNPELQGKEFSPELLANAARDCLRFQTENDLTGYPDRNAGHDFWLTRNGHGCGFWENDFGTEEQCAKLTAASKAFGPCELYAGDDGMIYGTR